MEKKSSRKPSNSSDKRYALTEEEQVILDKTKSIVGENIIKGRKKSDFNQQELADKLYTSPPTVSGWENFKSLPDAKSLAKLAYALNMEPYEFFKSDSQLEWTPKTYGDILVGIHTLFDIGAMKIKEVTENKVRKTMIEVTDDVILLMLQFYADMAKVLNEEEIMPHLKDLNNSFNSPFVKESLNREQLNMILKEIETEKKDLKTKDRIIFALDIYHNHDKDEEKERIYRNAEQRLSEEANGGVPFYFEDDSIPTEEYPFPDE